MPNPLTIKNGQQKVVDFKNQSSAQESLVVHDLKNETFDKLVTWNCQSDILNGISSIIQARLAFID